MDTAIAETRFRREQFLARTQEEPIEIDMRTYLADLDADLHDIRGRSDFRVVCDPNDYSAGQALGRELKAVNAYGVVYDSVRDQSGECADLLHPQVLSNCRQGSHFGYLWDGSRISTVIEKRIHAQY